MADLPIISNNAQPVVIVDRDTSNVADVISASTAAVAADLALAVALSPNSPVPAGSNNIGSITNITGTISLPTGAATAANQATEIASLAAIDAGIPAALGQTTMAASMPVVLASNQSAIPVTGTFWQATQPISGTITANQGTSPWVTSLASTTITGTVAVTQSTSPWVTNVTQWNSVALGSPTAYGTAPGAVNVIGVNSFVTNTVAENLTQINGTAAVVAAAGVLK